jgi:CheY-like chemotaxis protein
MSHVFTVYVVDDDPLVQEVLCSILEPEHAVQCFATAEACQSQLAKAKPDFFLLDISLPGIDGYEFCRDIKSEPRLAAIPVTFISAHENIEARLKGYDSGGEDFIVKPFLPDEVVRKVKVAKTLLDNNLNLREQAAAAEHLSSLALASMDEAGLVLQFMSQLISCETDRDVAAGLLELMRRYGLTGVVQTRVARRALTLSAAGQNIPLEVSVVDHVRTLGRVFEFHTRGVHNFDRVTVMAKNLPVADGELCGRLRDNLAVAAQGADARLRAIEIEESNQRNKAAILSALDDIGESISVLNQANELDRQRSREIINGLQDSLLKSFVTLGLTADQERLVETLVSRDMAQLIELVEHGGEIQSSLSALRNRLHSLNAA